MQKIFDKQNETVEKEGEEKVFIKIDPWYEPRTLLKDVVCEMSTEDHGFLCGLIKAYNPQRIVEIGVAEGGSTSVIANCLAMMQSSADLYSIDLSECVYYDDTLATGYEYERLKGTIAYDGKHTLLLGKTIAGQIEEIGGDIDFVILDTTHVLPGEILDFLAVLPYCKANAVFVLHDLTANYLRAKSDDVKCIRSSNEWIAPKLLYSTVTGKKYLNSRDSYIAAFQINADTYKYINNVFYALTMSWSYVPGDNSVDEYRTILCMHYTDEQLNLFDYALVNNRIIEERMRLTHEFAFPYESIKKDSDIILYGAGFVGKQIYHLLDKIGYCSIAGWVDKNYLAFTNEKYDVKPPEEMQNVMFDYIVVAVAGKKMFQEIKEEILKIIDISEDKIVGPLYRVK